MELGYELKDWLQVLKASSEKMKEKILDLYHSPDASIAFGRGAGGDITRKIDLEAEKALIDVLLEHNVSCTLVSEESGTKHIGQGPSKFILTTDPLDGTTNALRGVPFIAVSLAVSEKPYVKDIEVALVSDLIQDVTYTAEKGSGAFKNDQPVKPSQLTSLEEAVIGVDLNTLAAEEIMTQMAKVFEKCKHLRHFGANALEICYVADGTTDAFVDLRGKLRVTDIAAAQLVLREAGGMIRTKEDRELDAPLDATQRVSFVSAANKTLYENLHGLMKQN